MSYSITNCVLSEGLNLTGCTKNNTGGVSAVYIANFKEVMPGGSASQKFTYDSTTGEITSITTTGTTANYYQFDTVKETSGLAEAITVNIQNGTIVFAPTVTLVMNKLETKQRNLIHMLSLGLLVCVVKDNNDNFWMVGYNKGMDVTAVESMTGVALGDRNGSTLTISGRETKPMARLSGYLKDPVTGLPTGAVANLLAVASY